MLPISAACALSAITLALAAPWAWADEALPVASEKRDWEGATGLMFSQHPAYNGSSHQVFRIKPGLYLRWGRLAITNTGGFAVRRAEEDVGGGLGVDMLQGDRFSLGAALRYDGGRRERSSASLAGMGNIRSTLRARVTGSWRLVGPWSLRGSVNLDTLGHGSGHNGDIGILWDHKLGPSTALAVGGNLLLGSQRYMQAYYGVNDAQSLRSGNRVYTPGAGARDAVLYANLRHDIDRKWTAVAGASARRIVGPAAASPLTRAHDSWGVNAGIAWRF